MILKMLQSIGAIITDGHFVYTSGRHGSSYINKDALYLQPRKVSEIGRIIAEHFKNYSIETVVAPAVGGVILSQWVAYHLGQISHREVTAVYADKNDGHFVFKRGYDKFVAGHNLLLVDDIVNAGSSIKKMTELIHVTCGNLVAAGVICNRGGLTTSVLGLPELFSVLDLDLDSWPAENCTLCLKQVPINTQLGKYKISS